MLTRRPLPHLATLVALTTLSLPSHADPSATASPLTPDSVYADTFRFLAAGQQRDAENVLSHGIELFDRDPRLLFFAAACHRSRFDVDSAAPLFLRVARLDPAGKYGLVAAEILHLDLKHDIPAHFAKLRERVDANADDPLLLWMAAVQCRSLHENEAGIAYFDKLGKHFNPGPVLFHQTYANLLDQVGRSADAVPHRNLAICLEPAPWSYSALGDTMTLLKRWPEADDAYAQSLTYADTFHLWDNWSWSMQERGDNDGCIEKARRALQINPRSTRLWNRLGDASARRKDVVFVAEQCYRNAIECAPNDPYAYDKLAALLEAKGDPQSAAQTRATAATLRHPTTAPVASLDSR